MSFFGSKSSSSSSSSSIPTCFAQSVLSPAAHTSTSSSQLLPLSSGSDELTTAAVDTSAPTANLFGSPSLVAENSSSSSAQSLIDSSSAVAVCPSEQSSGMFHLSFLLSFHPLIET